MTKWLLQCPLYRTVVEAYRLGKYDNINVNYQIGHAHVVEAYRLGKYDNYYYVLQNSQLPNVVEAYRLGKYDNYYPTYSRWNEHGCRSLSFG